MASILNRAIGASPGIARGTPDILIPSLDARAGERQTGQFLSSAPLTATKRIYGAEFNLPIDNRVAEPESIVLLAMAAGAMAVVRRRSSR